ncbi:D-glutamate cyclase, mitochondrial-like isoform X3 [Ptychodera flava]|uniref:D-glutamate cyclase, mitochondrial-like isoform X3 n=1 Tax=Ptychodera flava TaxID=63121 RepID=UPI00396A5403
MTKCYISFLQFKKKYYVIAESQKIGITTKSIKMNSFLVLSRMRNLMPVLSNSYVRRMSAQPDRSKFVDVKTLSNALPKDVRQMIRKKKLADGQPTAGICDEYTQANLTIVHESLADDFEKFCYANFGAMPLIYKSKPGEYAAPGISHHDSDIRSDVPMYNVFVNGKNSKAVGSLFEYEQEMKKMSTFYLGCSFSFVKALTEAGVRLRSLEENSNVSMYTSNVRCHPVGVFDCFQVVSMMPIPRNQVEIVFQVTHPLEELHGAPVHIGDPALMGIADINKVDFGFPAKFYEGDVPVFWACGDTGLIALQAANLPLAFTHYPGSMYISDTPVKIHDLSSLPDKPKVIALKEEPFFASVTAESVVSKVKALEECIQDDPGTFHLRKHGISHLHIPDELIKSALSLSHASSVVIATGFPCVMNKTPPYVNDGLSGTIALATMLQALGKQVTIMVDTSMETLMIDIVTKLVSRGVIPKSLDVTSFPPSGQDANLQTAREFLSGEDDVHPKYQHLVAIGNISKPSDKTQRSDANLTSLVSPIDLLFDAAKDMPYVSTTEIGDGVNELGQGSEVSEVACEVAADYLITAGVSDWGGYALSMALYAVSLCPVHDRYLRKAVGFPLQNEDNLRPMLPTTEKQEAMLSVLMDHGICDGVLGELSMSVDGLPFHDVHAEKINELNKLTIT